MSLTEKLWKSKGNRTPVVEVLEKLEEAAKVRGLTVSRWQTNHRNYSVSITYAVHRGERPERAEMLMSQDKSAIACYLSQVEGTTERSQAFCELSRLLRRVEAIPVPEFHPSAPEPEPEERPELVMVDPAEFGTSGNWIPCRVFAWSNLAGGPYVIRMDGVPGEKTVTRWRPADTAEFLAAKTAWENRVFGSKE